MGVGGAGDMFGISEGMVSKIQRIVEREEKRDRKLNKLLKKYKVQT